MTAVIESKKSFVAKVPSTSLPISKELAQRAESTIQNLELPTTRNEAWKYTRVAKIGKVSFSNQAGQLDSVEQYIIDPTTVSFVFVNGRFSSEHSTRVLPEGISCELLSDSKTEELEAVRLNIEQNIFTAINTKHLTDGVLIKIADKAVIEQPIQIIHILDGDEIMSNFKTIIKAGAFSKATVVQGFF